MSEQKVVGRLLQTQVWGLVAMRERHAAEERTFCQAALAADEPTPLPRRDADAEAGVA